MTKRYFDAIIVTPLEEEFAVALECFEFVEDLSSDNHIRFAVRAPGSSLEVLLVKQDAMGRTAAQEACIASTKDFSPGILICLGIAGAISDDMNIGDVCYSGSIIDVLDNAKAYPVDIDNSEISFSPTIYNSPRQLSILLSLARLSPASRPVYQAWQAIRYEAARTLLPNEFAGRSGRRELVTTPKAIEGAIACGAVSSAPAYNKKIKAIDRKVLAIETESGGVFSVAKSLSLPALSIRGISDYAGVDKNRFEQETNGNARRIAATNAATFCALQLVDERIGLYFQRLRNERELPASERSLAPVDETDPLEVTLTRQADAFDEKLRALAPGYGLQARGYRLPVPRVRAVEMVAGFASPSPKPPMEMRDAISESRVVVVQLPREYPDLSLAWIMGMDLLSAQLGNKKVVPCVVEGELLRRPRPGIAELVDPLTQAAFKLPAAAPVVIIDNFPFDSKTKLDFLREQIRKFEDIRFVILTHSSNNPALESDFLSSVGAYVTRPCDISFVEIAHFLQKNFELPGPASEVVATRLRDTFEAFDLPVHPNYFAGIPRNVLDGLLQANRRAELIELAVAGYLSFVVADDDEPISLSRKTREQFLTALSFEINVAKRSYTEAELVSFAAAFAKKFDFKISPANFIGAFIRKGILFIDRDQVKFALPFMESYLLAKRLHQEPGVAEQYFEITSSDFDHSTFSIYAEMGASKAFVEDLLRQLDVSITALEGRQNDEELVLSDKITPAMIVRPDRIQAFQRRLEKATSDVRDEHDASAEKQKYLDAMDRVQESAARRTQNAQGHTPEEQDARQSLEGDATAAWFTGISLLGSGAERLEAETKRTLISRLLHISALIIADWTAVQVEVDYTALKAELEADQEFCDSIAGSESKGDQEEAKTVIDGLVDVIEFGFLADPFVSIISALCEGARDNVLSESIVNVKVNGKVERLLHAIWLADVDTPRGRKLLSDAVKAAPKARFLRMVVAIYLVNRVYWMHWKKDDRLALLDIADESIRALGLQYNKSAIKRMIEREKKAVPDDGEL